MSDDASEIEAVSRNSAKQTVDPVKSFLSGGFGGVSCVLVGHPFDLTKTRLQTAPPGVYTGAIDVVKKTVKADGFRGMYRGVTPPILGVTPIFAISFWGYDLGKRLVYSFSPDRTEQALSIPELAFAGAFSALPATLVAAPAERVKVLLQVQGQNGSQAYNGVFDVVTKLYAEGGIRSLFRGTVATLARDGPGSAAYFATYEYLKKMLSAAPETLPDGSKAPAPPLSVPAIMAAGGGAGIAMWSLGIPPDTIKSRLQSAPQGTYTGFMDCARKLIAQDGVTALWKGFGPAMARAVPANAATFLGVELSLKMMDKMW
ncbi:solute carrier family 25 (mitochondrial carnitine/acylcarnitine transporter), member 20/29 [Cryptococcus deuterogattii 99/473]|uniref:Solute carrier family 25 (Mitochondrial carnitine/acylcarnitine transporter), member 20/29 n=1 Tax=Cryptococcus deuterogattii Ram5 TaxID=1296110 RepID=A0A0D0T8E6_9TREE|nr:solute carrier family 25 (mitochondrial carnitine/acylcarnitine transporter), member 20/29 [Cryptococcus deuterogattii LA55]KIR35539.1 solute carrier family 25 (mitochondrial carnitine/acylcarnitine transporter), member 20/29 [Cryptococcus deuterogattii MMRL2647]KIR42267.1 solute carrier family 25 (mitochondrial carnitine/acylcarnitine transporter), member 20/29 [Cryptococcus deuterogattii Ram5]KIR94913.1 solute carrier family 25 (mitochondrial carnitine/acylcarnitine transporter), member 20/